MAQFLTGREDISDGDVLNEGGVDARALNSRLEDSGEEVLREARGEATLASL